MVAIVIEKVAKLALLPCTICHTLIFMEGLAFKTGSWCFQSALTCYTIEWHRKPQWQWDWGSVCDVRRLPFLFSHCASLFCISKDIASSKTEFWWNVGENFVILSAKLDYGYHNSQIQKQLATNCPYEVVIIHNTGDILGGNTKQ